MTDEICALTDGQVECAYRLKRKIIFQPQTVKWQGKNVKKIHIQKALINYRPL